MTPASVANQVFQLSRLALAAHDGDIAVLEMYMDESGTHDGSPTIVVAGYLGRPEAWRDWTEKWTAALGSTKVYHAVDAQNLTGEFEGWTSAEVGELVKKLLPITAGAEIAATAVAMDLRVFETAMKGRDDLKKLFGTPYIACLQWAMQAILNMAANVRNSEAIAFIHENNNFHTQAYECFSWIKENTNRGDNVISLTFGGKKEYVPLQAADILAYESNKRLRKLDAPERRPWAALKANTFVANYGPDNMDYLVETLEKIKNGQFDEITRGTGWNRSWTSR
jgi:hypothetical protein